MGLKNGLDLLQLSLLGFRGYVILNGSEESRVSIGILDKSYRKAHLS
jgi:hypothetical protein